MSRTLTPYLVDFTRLHASIGSNDASLHEALGANTREPQSIALCELIAGKEPTPSAEDCAFAMEALCQHFGRPLPNGSVAPLDFDLREEVDSFLEARDLRPIRLLNLIYGGAPVLLPQVDDFPQVGHITPGQVTAAWKVIQQRPLESDVDYIDAVLVDITCWVQRAAANQAGLVGFLY